MSEKLLLVDDDEFIRSVTQEVLVNVGYEIVTAGDGQDAWKILDQSHDRFDLILLDKNMPRMDGIALLKRLKADQRFRDLPVIMLTGDKRQQDITEGLAAGAYYYLTKPSTEEVLKLVIQNALSECREKQDLRALLGQQKNNLSLMHRAEFRYRTLAEAKDLALLLADASADASRTLIGYSELLINAVEHGNLGITYEDKSALMTEGRWIEEVEARLKSREYAERVVEVTLEKTTAVCRVTITDQGNGFDWQKFVNFTPERAFDLHGRGIAMSKVISFDSIEYIGKGNQVVTTMNLKPTADAD